MGTTAETAPVDRAELETKVKQMYRAVALEPTGHYHFKMGRGLAEQLGYPPALLDQLPAGAVDSFAGVGYFFDLAGLAAGEKVLDLGSGSGMDVFAAAVMVGGTGEVVGLDITPEQLEKAEKLRAEADFPQVRFVPGHIETIPLSDASFDCVISNGVINLSPEKHAVFREAARVLRPGGRLAVADIVSERPLTQKIVCNTELWASCIGGAAQTDDYQQMITDCGFTLESVRQNDYEFISDSARAASTRYGVISVSLLARR
ncbi:methylase [Arthrobacter crystallopoietes BAB-32]|uniref:Arsenite methyltransferase n=1 Tax=Arthrobacter crystallopoietes BAB-32 TaxID=1246476 RepID=N1UQU8_9MICC|nr:methyltransferase domain-containing protein [Arthrobacter crystallopoietes]EMY32771.1 methylase [Arthrobacter crystallopoietes BAB-32]